MKHILIIFIIFLLSLTIISCSSEDDSALKDGKVAANLSEADQFEPPNISLITINDSVEATNQTTVSVKLSGADAVGITGYIISNQSTVPNLTSSDWVSITSQTQYSVSKDLTVGPSDASYSLYGWMRDEPGGISATASSSIIYDSTAPTLSSVSINSGDSSTSNTVVNLTISASDSLSGISAYYASETSTDPSATATGWVDITSTNSLSSTVSFTLSSPGAAGSFTKNVYLWVRDVAGNVSSSASDSITLIVADTTAPTSPGISINSGSSTTTSSSVTLSLSATDDIGVTGYYLSQTSSTPSSSASGWTSVTSATSYSDNAYYTLSGGNGTNTVYVWFKDGAGNVSSSASDSITLQDDPPSNPSISINSGASTTTSSSVTLSLSASDDIGVTGYYLSQTSSTPSSSTSGWISVTSATSYSDNASYTLTGGDGTNTVYVWFKDGAGNVSSSASDSINLQDDPPSNPSISIGSGATSTVSPYVSLTISATDDIGVTGYYLSQTSSTPSSSASGWTSLSFSATSYSGSVSYTLTGGNGTNTVYVWFKDSAGNISSSASDTITYHSIPNIYCGLNNSSTGGASALSATKLTSGNSRTANISAGNDQFFFFNAESAGTYQVNWSGNNILWYNVYKGVGNSHTSTGTDDYNSSISNFTGNVIIKFSAYSSSSGTVTFNITGATIQNYHTVKNPTCQISVSGGSTSLQAAMIGGGGGIYTASIAAGVDEYFAFIGISSSKTYSIMWSGNNILWYNVYKGVGNSHTSTGTDDYNSSISNFTGNVIIKFSAYSSSSGSVDFKIHEE